MLYDAGHSQCYSGLGRQRKCRRTAMSQFSDFTKAVESGAKTLARSTLKEFLTQAQSDVNDFLANERANLQKWTKQLANGELTRTEFKSLVRGERDLAQLLALTNAGVATAKLQRFRDGLIDLVISSAFKIL